MRLFDLMAIAAALGMDVMSVCMAIGVRWHGRRQKFRLAWHMGLFQFVMPLLGYLAGHETASAFAAAGKYVAAAIVAGIGAKMLYEVIKSHPGAMAERTEDAIERAEESVERALHRKQSQATGHKPQEKSRKDSSIVKDPTLGWSLVALSVATSVDALLVGFSLGLRGSVDIWATSAAIGVMAAAMSLCGVVIGRRAGVALGRPAEILGAVALIVLGVTFVIV